MTQELITQVTESVLPEVFGIWFLIGAALVFFMQAGFAMVETGFTRAKNAGNIIMHWEDSSESRILESLQIMQISTGLISYLT